MVDAEYGVPDGSPLFKFWPPVVFVWGFKGIPLIS
jgi:hypothetical protein